MEDAMTESCMPDTINTDHRYMLARDDDPVLEMQTKTSCEEQVMKKYLSLIWVPLFVLASQAASAGSMRCGTYLIEDGQIPGQSQSEVEEKCGTPQSVSGNNLYYNIGNVTYRLHFNTSDELESITEEQE